MKSKIAVIGLKGLPLNVGAGNVGENSIDQLEYKFDFYAYNIFSYKSKIRLLEWSLYKSF